MADPYISEIRLFAGNFAPVGWLLCDGSLQQISAFDSLFNLIGTTYGGDGQSTFALPDFRGRVPVHQGNGFSLGQTSGTEQVTLVQGNLPAHAHNCLATSQTANSKDPSGALLAQTDPNPAAVLYIPPAGQTPVAMAATIGNTGAGSPHDNLQPFQCVTFMICYDGIYPNA